jgi:predicted phage terminase large subunit-like protein
MPENDLIQQNKKEILERFLTLSFDFYRFFVWCWHLISEAEFIPNWHIKAIADELQYISYFIINKLVPPYKEIIINVPPGSTKSTLIVQAWSIWLKIQAPWIGIITVSNSRPLAVKNSNKAKGILTHEEFIFFQQIIEKMHGAPIILQKNKEDYWTNNHGGFFIATSTQKSIIGEHAHLHIIDDGDDNIQINSEAYREKNHHYLDQVLSQRKSSKDKCVTVTLQQRLHGEDCTGHKLATLKQDDIYHICLPAIDEFPIKPEKYKKYYKDGMLDPVRLSRDVLNDQRYVLGSVGFAGQYGQQPVDPAGNIIKKEWIKYIDETMIPSGGTRAIFIDSAYTKKTENDPTGLFDLYFFKNNIYLLNFINKKQELPELVAFVISYAKINGVRASDKIKIEPKASGYSLEQYLKKESNLSVSVIKDGLIKMSKGERLTTVGPVVESGRFYISNQCSNTDEAVSQITQFPKWPHDEAVDLLSYGINHFILKLGLVEDISEDLDPADFVM